MWNSLIQLIAPEPTEAELLAQSIQAGTVDRLKAFLDANTDEYVLQFRVGSAESPLNLLQLACYAGNLAAVQMLAEKRFPLDAKTASGGNTALHLAAMKGSEPIVGFLTERGASVCARNNANQNVFDVATGLQLRQNLMKLVLQEEQRNGTAPALPPGASKDVSGDQQRLRNLPPPPVYSSASGNGANSVNIAASTPVINRIQPDGFVTTVGNPNLASKYGNQTQTRLDVATPSTGAPPPMMAAALPPVIQAASMRPPPPRYVVNAPGMNIIPPPPPQQQQQQQRASGGAIAAPAPAARNVTVFDPGALSQ